MIIFQTPGLIDLRSFTTMGVSAKPNSDRPIGQFGTGLKYAIATLVRLGAEPVLWIGKDKYTFVKKSSEFRGHAIDLLAMKMEKWNWRKPRWTELPFTTEYGKFWQPWQAFRELEANTRDEQGSTVEAASYSPVEGQTAILVDHPEFDKVWTERDEIFLPEASPVASVGKTMELFQRPSNFLYYRGMRVFELGKPSLFIYNILKPVELTEDRTLKYEFYAFQILGDFVATLNDGDLIKKIITCDDDKWESGIDFSSWSHPAPGSAFMLVARGRPSGLRSSAMKHFSEYEPSDEEEQWPKPWEVRGDWIVDSAGKNLFAKPADFRGDWRELADKIVEMQNDS